MGGLKKSFDELFAEYCIYNNIKNILLAKINGLINSKIQRIITILAKSAIQKYPEYYNDYNKRARNLLEVLYKPVINDLPRYKMYGITANENACFMNSVIMALFAVPNDFIDRSFLETNLKLEEKMYCYDENDNKSKYLHQKQDLDNRIIVQDELRKLVYNIRNNDTSSFTSIDFKRTFKNCPNQFNFDINNPNDSGEFLSYLLELFNVNCAKISYVKYRTHDRRDFSEIPPENLKLSSYSIMDNIILSIDDEDQSLMIPVSDGLSKMTYIKDGDETMITVRHVNDSPYIVFYHDINNNTILPTEIVISNDKQYHLLSIVAFFDGHYVSYIKCNNSWYYYNDMRTPLLEDIGSYDNMIHSSRYNPMENGTLFFYG